MQTLPKHIETPELRKFGLLFGVLISVFGGFLIPWLWGLGWPLWPWLCGAIFAGTAVFAPRILELPYRGWMRIGHAMGWINSRIILSFLFFAVVTPIALLFKLLGKDPLQRKLDPTCQSYRDTSEPHDRESLERPF